MKAKESKAKLWRIIVVAEAVKELKLLLDVWQQGLLNREEHWA